MNVCSLLHQLNGFITLPLLITINIIISIVVSCLLGPALAIVVNGSDNAGKYVDEPTTEAAACTVLSYRLSESCVEVCDGNQTLLVMQQQRLAMFEKLAPTRLTGDLFTACPGVKIFAVNDSVLHEIADSAFVDAAALEELVLARNQLTELKNGSFVGTVLKRLDVSGNGIELVESDALKTLNRLTYVDLSANRIAHLPLRLFNDCPTLATILLRGNRIGTLELHLTTRALQLFDAAGNGMETLALKMLLLKRQSNTYQRNFNNLTLVLDANHLNNITLSAVPQLHQLSLARNNLSNLILLTMIKPLTVKILNLDDNDLRDIDARQIATNRMETLRLSGNQISSLDVDDLMFRVPKLNNITLAHNDWYCRDLYRTVAQLQQRKVHVSDVPPTPPVTSNQHLNTGRGTDHATEVCFDPQREIIKLQQKYDYRLNQILLIVVATVALLLLLITFITVSSCRALQRVRSDSLSKSFDIKMMPTENIYEEAVYNNVYSNPTTTL